MNTLAIVGMGAGVSMSVARRFGREGHSVAMLARRTAPLGDFQRALAADDIAARAYAADAADAESLKAALERVSAEMGPIGVLVYNAAVMETNPLLAMSPEELVGTFRINVAGALAAAQAVIPAMRVARSGTILLTGGGFALEPIPARAALGIGKAGIRNLAYSLFTECRPAGIHAAVVTIWGVVGSAPQFEPERIAESYWALHAQSPAEFEREVILR
jgi:short-subunit dehydrogenase